MKSIREFTKPVRIPGLVLLSIMIVNELTAFASLTVRVPQRGLSSVALCATPDRFAPWLWISESSSDSDPSYPLDSSSHVLHLRRLDLRRQTLSESVWRRSVLGLPLCFFGLGIHICSTFYPVLKFCTVGRSVLRPSGAKTRVEST